MVKILMTGSEIVGEKHYLLWESRMTDEVVVTDVNTNEVVITGIDIKFGDMVLLLFQITFALIPVLVVVGILTLILSVAFGVLMAF